MNLQASIYVKDEIATQKQISKILEMLVDIRQN